jgi:hypothetical protein
LAPIGTVWHHLAGLATSGKSGNVWQGWQHLASLEMSFNELPCFREAKALIGSR